MKSPQNVTDLQSILTAIARCEVSPVYLVSGNEDYLVFKARQQIAEELLRIIPGASFEIIDGSDTDLDSLLNRLNSPSLFEPTQIIVLRDARIFDAGKSDNLKPLIDWINRFNVAAQTPPAVLICTVDKVDKRTGSMKLMSKMGVFLEFQTPAGYDRGDIQKDPYYPVAAEVLTSVSKRIRSEAWMRFRQKTANNLWAVMNSLDMLISSLDSHPEIEVQHVDALLGFSDDIPVFAVTDALGKRDAIALSQSLDALLSTGTPTLVILKLLVNRINVLLAAKAFLKKYTPDRWNSKMEYWRFKNEVYPTMKSAADQDPAFSQSISNQHPYSLFLTLQQASLFDFTQLKHAIFELAEIDVAVKSTNKSPLVLFEMALMPLCR